MTENLDDNTRPPELELISGQGVDPSDVSDQSEELEALSVRFQDDISLLERKYPVPTKDEVIKSLLRGFYIIDGAAQDGGEKTIEQSVDASIKAFIKRVEEGDPQGMYKSLAKEEAEALRYLKDAIFGTYFDDFKADHPSEGWSDKEVSDAVNDAFAQSAAILQTLYPQQPGEEPLDYTHRLQQIMGDASEQILKTAEAVKF